MPKSKPADILQPPFEDGYRQDVRSFVVFLREFTIKRILKKSIPSSYEMLSITEELISQLLSLNKKLSEYNRKLDEYKANCKRMNER